MRVRSSANRIVRVDVFFFDFCQNPVLQILFLLVVEELLVLPSVKDCEVFELIEHLRVLRNYP